MLKFALKVATQPSGIALCVTLLFLVRFLSCLPFSGFTRSFNYETVATLTSYFMFAAEPLSFPLGVITGLSYPFQDANVGNVGALPLFAVFFKVLGINIPYFKTFDYFILVEIISCFLTAYFSQKILVRLGVIDTNYRALIALLTGTSFLLLTRSGWLQPFCVVAFPLFTAWVFCMLQGLQRAHWMLRQDVGIVAIFPIAALTDTYTLVGILLGTGILVIREVYEVIFGGGQSSRNRALRFLMYFVTGVVASLFVLYLIGMFPLPPLPNTFSSYDFGIGGRYHGADLLAPIIPVANKVAGFPESSLLGRFLPFNTDSLAAGQYEGVAYVGTPVLLLGIALIAIKLLIQSRKLVRYREYICVASPYLVLYSPWKKIGLAAAFVFLFSLGYELHIAGHAFVDFSGMPAAWLADRFKALYNIRAMGRLASLLSLYITIELVRQMFVWKSQIDKQSQAQVTKGWNKFSALAVGAMVAIHLLEIAPFLKPIAAQPIFPIGGVFSKSEVSQLKALGSENDVVFIAPSVRAVGVEWTTEAFALAYYLGIKSNLYYLARTDPVHDIHIAKDLDRVLAGDWDAMAAEYKKRIVFAIPIDDADRLRPSLSKHYTESRVGQISVWSLIDSIKSSSKVF